MLELPQISTKDFSREGQRLRTRTFAARQAFRNDGAGGLFDGSVSESRKLREKRCLSSAWPARKNNAMHGGDVLPSRLTD